MYLGLDIGTTTVCGVVLDENGKIVSTVTEANTFASANGAARMQDADGIFALCARIYRASCESFPIRTVGISGQMHGILYVDAAGKAASPLYSWQDERGNLPYRDGSYVSHLSRLCGYSIATGYGASSLFYDAVNGKIPANAHAFCTVGDYIAMRLCGRQEPLLHPTVAASVGLFDLAANAWDKDAIARADLPVTLFPAITKTLVPLGETAEGCAVYPAVGDNQASVYGALADDACFVVNVGTGSQISVVADTLVTPASGEVRPYFGGKYLLAGCALCGGYSFRLLRDFFAACGSPVGYDEMNAMAEEALANGDSIPVFSPTFRGTREDPSLAAAVSGITVENFTPRAFVLALMRGVSRELKDFYNAFLPFTGRHTRAVGAGNAVRLNSALRRVIEEDHGLPLVLPSHKEEAAFGAALLAAEAYTGQNLKHFIRYH